MFEHLGVINLSVFVVGAVLVILMPGPNSLYVLATAVRRGARDAVKAAAAVVVGDGVLMLLAALGAGSAARLYPTIFSTLQYAGAAYLAYIGLRMLLGAFRGGNAATNEDSAPSRENPFRRALLLSLSNPKAILFFVSFFVQFVDPSKGSPGIAFLLLASIVQLVSMSYLSFLIFSGSRLGAAAKKSSALRRAGAAVTGAAFLGFGCNLALRAAA